MSTGAPAAACAAAQDPSPVTNPPNAATIAYRVGDFDGFRRALLESLPGEGALAGWHPAAGDLGLQVLEWWAYLADVLTFYNERVANESYLRTAQLPASLSGLVALLGYRPRPGIAATGRLAALRGARHPGEPLAIPAGTRFASQATPGVPVQTYESLIPLTFESQVSSTVVVPPADSELPHLDPAGGSASVLLAGTVHGLAAGQQLLLLRRGWSGADQNWAQVTVSGAVAELDPYGARNTRVGFSSLTWGLQLPQPKASTLDYVTVGSEYGRSGRLVLEEASLIRDPLTFDPPPAAPETNPQVEDYVLLRPLQTAALWSAAGAATTGTYGQDFGVRLSAVVRAIAPGDPVLFSDGSPGGGAVLGVVAGTTEELLTIAYPGAPPPTPATIPVAHTVLTLTLPSQTDADSLADLSQVATAVRYGYREVGTLVASPATALPALPATLTAVKPLPALSSAAAFIQDATGAGIPVAASTAGGSSVSLQATAETPSAPTLVAPLVLLTQLVPVSQGASVASELLGSGDATQANQTFTLARAPLTYLAQGAGYVSTLRIAVDGSYWTEVESVYGQAANATIFTVSQREDGTSVVRFGDGVEGARLPSGAQVLASYRYGSGAASPPAGRLTTILKPQPNLAAVANPWAVAGGADPEPPSSIRTAAPASVLTFARVISADDYETVAAGTAGVTRARAYWSWDAAAQRAIVKVYVGDGAAAAGLAASALAGADDPNRPVSVLAASAIELNIACGIVIAAGAVPADVIAAAQAALASLFAPGGLRIGETLYASRIAAALMVPGAVALQGLRVPELIAGALGAADPGEGRYFTLASTPNLWPVGGDG